MMCKDELKPGGCIYGDNCYYLHTCEVAEQARSNIPIAPALRQQLGSTKVGSNCCWLTTATIQELTWPKYLTNYCAFCAFAMNRQRIVGANDMRKSSSTMTTLRHRIARNTGP